METKELVVAMLQNRNLTLLECCKCNCNTTEEAQAIYQELRKEGYLSKQEAVEQGLTFYYTGKACRKGHKSSRYASSGNCLECHKEREQLKSNLITIKYKIKPEWKKAIDDLVTSLRAADEWGRE